MPIKAKPNATFNIILSNDRDRPEHERAIFTCRYLTVAQWSDVAEISEKFDRSKSSKERLSLAAEIIKAGVCGWQNLTDPDTSNPIESVQDIQRALTLGEYIELMHAVYLQVPSFEDKKKLDSQSDSNSEPSAEVAKG